MSSPPSYCYKHEPRQKNSAQNILDYNLQLDGCTVTSSTVKNLGVILDRNLSFENHISNVTKTAFFHLRNIAKLRNMLPLSDAEKLVHAFMTSRLDYCNALLGVTHWMKKHTMWNKVRASLLIKLKTFFFLCNYGNQRLPSIVLLPAFFKNIFYA